MGYGAWGMGSVRKNRIYASSSFTLPTPPYPPISPSSSPCPMPNAQCPMPISPITLL
ncbi:MULTISPECIES: hypothetical protein [Nostoc]|uniref:Uncharacterized protein n=1 Tax=Nostoc paludosum FACHB-159 TaxID=2692908 RepID=A0ABR8KBB6_9NOSO|nr:MULTISPECIES: hypothetical protein [Nostoc]MBD2679882.1 hypothetical protein [Nostoc sp. FACHB-857]MBD2736136.1 hypothetical protein [Nostoc paludosum FACHB-159]